MKRRIIDPVHTNNAGKQVDWVNPDRDFDKYIPIPQEKKGKGSP